MGPNEERRIAPVTDIRPTTRLTPIDVVTMTEVEVRATLVHLTGNPNPVIREALLDAVQGVLERTRP